MFYLDRRIFASRRVSIKFVAFGSGIGSRLDEGIYIWNTYFQGLRRGEKRIYVNRRGSYFIRNLSEERRLIDDYLVHFFFFFSIGKRSFLFFERGNYEDDGSRASRRGFRKTRERSLCKSKRGREGR